MRPRATSRATGNRRPSWKMLVESPDSLPGTRTGMMRILPNAQASGAQTQQDAQRGQGSFFDLDDGPGAVAEPDLPVPELPDERGRFGPFGGRFVPEILVPALERLEAGVRQHLHAAEFQREFQQQLRDWAGRPTADSERMNS